MKKTETILREDGSIYKEVDHLDDLVLRIAIIKKEITEPLYYKNEHGGMDLIDEFGCSDYHAFSILDTLLKEVIQAQMKLRLEKR